MAEVDLGALLRNTSRVAAAVAPARLLAVLKADAYGHGAVACARALAALDAAPTQGDGLRPAVGQPAPASATNDGALVWGFAVSLVEEGVELRRAGITKPIVVLGGYYGRSHLDVVAYGLTPVVFHVEDVQRFGRAADELAAERVGLHLKIDTGMARLGVRRERLGRLLEAVRHTPAVAVTGLLSHLAEADDESLEPTREQLAEFERARADVLAAGFRPTLLHVANTAGALRFPQSRYDLVRPGLALFGYLPASTVTLPGLDPVMSLRTRIVALRELPSGSPVSYGARFRTPRQSRIATIPIGYADGYTRRMSGRAEVIVSGRRVPVVGAITMDMTMIDVTDVPAGLGQDVVLLGRQDDAVIDAVELAEWSDTIVYELMCSISKRVPRVYHGDGQGRGGRGGPDE